MADKAALAIADTMQSIAPEPYRVRPDGRLRQSVLSDIHKAVYTAHGTDERYGYQVGKIFAAPLFDYLCFLDALCESGRFQFLSVKDCLTRTLAGDRPAIVLRHDIDLDIDTAMQMAALERERNIPASYYILHTAPYYGNVEDGIFVRYEEMASVYRTLAEHGHDVGLHNDALGLVQMSGLNGLQALETELRWLRDIGIAVEGTAAHNSYTTYGVENFAVFKGRPQRMYLGGCPETITLGGRTVRLQSLEERLLGLVYEANELFWRTDVTVRYACAWNVDLWHWQERRNMRLPEIDDPQNRPQGKELIRTAEFLDRIGGLAPGELLLLAIHPLYFGARTGPQASASLHPAPTPARRRLWWSPAWKAHELVVGTANDEEGNIASVGINVADASGALRGALLESGDVEVLLVGRQNFDGRNVTGPAHFSVRLMEKLRAATGRNVGVRNCAYPQLSARSSFGVLRRGLRSRQAAVAVVELGNFRLRDSRAMARFIVKVRNIAGKIPVVFVLGLPELGEVVARAAELTGATIVDPYRARPCSAEARASLWPYALHEQVALSLSQVLTPIVAAHSSGQQAANAP